MKKLLAILLAFSILSQNLMNVAIGVYYHVNKEYISKQLCENRNNPQIHCNGHCYLSKQLQKAEHGEKQSAQLIKEKEEIIANPSESLPGQYFPTYTVHNFRAFNSDLYISFSPHALIKPPAAA
jgi:hypothetical protein